MTSDQKLGTSVLLPVFWRQVTDQDLALLRRAIESVEDQAYPGPHEILLIDDGSAVPVESLKDRIGDAALFANVRFIRVHRNNGLVNALNVGLNRAQYPFIARMDADDRWLPGKIEKQFALFAADPDLTITATGMTLVDPSFNPIEAHIRPGDWTGILKFFVDVGCPFPHGSVLARRDVWHLLGGYSHNPLTAHCEDYALWGIWLRFFKPAMVEEALYDYTVSGGSVSAIHGAQQRRASGLVNGRFGALDPANRIPGGLVALAEALGTSVLEAGKFAHALWAYRTTARVPRAAITLLIRLMPDRFVLETPGDDGPAMEPVREGEAAPVGETVRIRVS